MVVYKDPRRIVVMLLLCVDFELKCVAIIPACYQSGYQLFNVSNLYGVWLRPLRRYLRDWFLEVSRSLFSSEIGFLEISQRIIYKVNFRYNQYVCILYWYFRFYCFFHGRNIDNFL